MSQSRKASLAETMTNVAIGYLVSLASQLAIFPVFGIHIAFHDNVAIGLWFTVVSIARSYVLRRAYNHFSKRSA